MDRSLHRWLNVINSFDFNQVAYLIQSRKKVRDESLLDEGLIAAIVRDNRPLATGIVASLSDFSSNFRIRNERKFWLARDALNSAVNLSRSCLSRCTSICAAAAAPLTAVNSEYPPRLSVSN